MRRETVFGSGLATAAVLSALVGCSSQAGAPTDAPQPPPAARTEAGATPDPRAKGFPSELTGDDAAKDAAGSGDDSATADVPALIAGFQSAYSVRVFETTEQFRKLPADVRRSVLAELSAQEDASVRHNAWRAFAAWAAREDVPTLIAALESPYEDVRSAALALLARFPNAETIGVLTKVLEDPLRRERAEELLVSVGPAAEQALLAYVTHTDAGLRTAAWRILGQIGTRKSLLLLEQAATQADFQKDPELKDAMQRIRERLRR
ncbi:MAG TPA: HEAT repeat domain-containing protein [Pirellulaceae bacterium]|nr:HEAT repeat domain-containing protein [Pirellulaceae bacterium]